MQWDTASEETENSEDYLWGKEFRAEIKKN